jgi:hypothetical protein
MPQPRKPLPFCDGFLDLLVIVVLTTAHFFFPIDKPAGPKQRR